MNQIKQNIWKESFSQVFDSSTKVPALIVVEECSSTMDLARSVLNGDTSNFLIGDSTSDQIAIFSLSQSSGRGRKARVWESAHTGGMYLSILDKTARKIPALSGLSLTIGLAIQNIVKSYKIDAKLKWPNDVLVHEKKISGILIETLIKQDHAQVIYGIGLNINQESFSNVSHATSMSLELKSELSYEVICAKVVKSVLDYVDLHMMNEFTSLKSAWWDESLMDGRLFRNDELQISGVAIGVNDEGALVVRCEDGGVREIYAGDVS